MNAACSARHRRWMRRCAAIACATSLLLAVSCGDQGDGNTGAPTTSSAAVTSTAPPSTTTTEPPTTTAAPTTTSTPEQLPVDDRAFVVWPFPGSTTRYADPVAAARAFAIELVGYTDPVLSAFRAGDGLSGEVVVRPSATGPETTVLVRRFVANGSWWVTGSTTADIEVTYPVAQGAVDNPLQSEGRARAFEGTVEVAIILDGSTTPLGSGYVTGASGPELLPFRGSTRFTPPQGGWGSVIFFTRSMEDGRVSRATVIRVGFIGGD